MIDPWGFGPRLKTPKGPIRREFACGRRAIPLCRSAVLAPVRFAWLRNGTTEAQAGGCTPDRADALQNANSDGSIVLDHQRLCFTASSHGGCEAGSGVFPLGD